MDRSNVQGDLLSLPFKDHSFEEIHLVHVFEHIKRPNQLPVLRELHRVLEKGGALFIEVPDFKSGISLLVGAWKAGNKQMAHNMTASLYGKQRYPGDAHHWAFTPDTLNNMLRDAAAWGSSELPTEMISSHHKQEPVLLVKVTR